MTPQKFQSTCPRGARHPGRRRGCVPIHFNPRAHEGHDNNTFLLHNAGFISIHVPTRGTTAGKRKNDQHQNNFNPRAHEGHDNLWPLTIPSDNDFNPRAHEGHDRIPYAWGSEKFISIHVPTRGTTVSSANVLIHIYISIHVPTRGTTLCLLSCRYLDIFQSTCPRGARRSSFFFSIHAALISIHVPTRGTTSPKIWIVIYVVFQSTCPRGARLVPLVLSLFGYISIHVPTRGTTVYYQTPEGQIDFNPRAHEGHDSKINNLPIFL